MQNVVEIHIIHNRALCHPARKKAYISNSIHELVSTLKMLMSTISHVPVLGVHVGIRDVLFVMFGCEFGIRAGTSDSSVGLPVPGVPEISQNSDASNDEADRNDDENSSCGRENTKLDKLGILLYKMIVI